MDYIDSNCRIAGGGHSFIWLGKQSVKMKTTWKGDLKCFLFMLSVWTFLLGLAFLAGCR
jgi:hypothetical protein